MITPRLDPLGSGLLQRASPLSKLAWFTAVTVAVGVANSWTVACVLGVQCLVLYILLIRTKSTPAPPVLRFVAMMAGLLFCFNLLFGGSPLGQWYGEPRAVAHAALVALRLVTTTLAFVVFTLSTVPRDFARSLGRLGVPRALTEAIAIGLRFPAVFEVDSRMLLRIRALRYARTLAERRSTWPQHYFRQLVVGVLAMALSQTNATAQSLTLHSFDASVTNRPYPVDKDARSSWILIIFGGLSLVMTGVGWLRGTLP